MRSATEILLLALWLGGAAIVAAVVAPAAFAVLPTRALAGTLVGRTLPVLFVGGLAIALAVGGLEGLAPPSVRSPLVLGALAVLGVSCAAAQLVVAPRIAQLRVAIGPSVDALLPGDPRRTAFGRLHGLSVALLGAGMVAASVATAATVARTARG